MVHWLHCHVWNIFQVFVVSSLYDYVSAFISIYVYLWVSCRSETVGARRNWQDNLKGVKHCCYIEVAKELMIPIGLFMRCWWCFYPVSCFGSCFNKFKNCVNVLTLWSVHNSLLIKPCTKCSRNVKISNIELCSNQDSLNTIWFSPSLYVWNG